MDTGTGADHPDTCDAARELISAALDGEASAAEGARVEHHLAECPACREFHDAAAALTRRARLRTAAPNPTFVAHVLADARPARLGRFGWARPVLAWCAVVIAAQSFSPLVLGDVDGAPEHIARHVGASSLALACGLLYAVWRPHRSYALLPFVGALLAATVVSAVFDTVDGNRSALAEATHLAEVVGTVVLWIVAGSPGWDRVVSLFRPHHRGRPGAGGLRPTS